MSKEPNTVKRIFRSGERRPTLRQVKLVQAYVLDNGRRTKGEILREVGYSPNTAIAPSKVFESRPVLRLMEEMGVTEKLGMEILKRNSQARVPVHFTFPPFNSKKAEAEESEDEEDEGFNSGEKFGEQLTDDQIREYLKGAGCTVTKIVHGDQARHVYCYTLNNKAQLATADMIFNLTGAYAPKKVEGKHDHRVGIFSMRDLREKMRENGIEITDQIIKPKQ